MELKYTHKSPYTDTCYNEPDGIKRAGTLKECKGVPFLVFPELERLPYIRHGFSTREGGVSQGYFSAMNLGFGRGDTRENVMENYRRFCGAVGIQPERMVFSDQVHEDTVCKVGNLETAGTAMGKKLERVDGIVTDQPEITLVNSYADCVPLLFVDTGHRVVAGSHSGWRGTVKKIGKKTIECMKEWYGTQPADVLAVIGPSICVSCYEVSEDVAEEFQRVFSKNQWETFLFAKPDQPGKYQLDLWKANQCILLDAGIKKENISVSCICTCCNSKHLYSHRASKGKRGNLVSMISLCQ